MASTSTYLGGKSLGQGLPFLLPIGAALEGIVGLTLPDIQARLAGALDASLVITPPSVALGVELLAALQVAIELPGIELKIMAQLIAELSFMLGELTLALNLAIQFSDLLGAVGIHFYLLEGDIGGMGTALQGSLGGGMPGSNDPLQQGLAVVVLAGDNGAMTAIRTLFGIGPTQGTPAPPS